MQMSKYYSLGSISFPKIFLSFFFFAFFFFAFFPSIVKAASVNVTGYAWSSNIGWIKFDHGKTNPVKYDDSTGKLSGYAWSNNIGWIKFDGLSSYPSGGTNSEATASPLSGTGYFKGWARACAGTLSGTCATMEPRMDGWDGWIKFDTGKDNPVTINYSTGDFHGYAWGSEVVGWISFNCNEGGSTGGSVCRTSNYFVSIPPPEDEQYNTITVNVYGEKWTDGSTIAGGSVTGTSGFSCVGNKTTDSSIAVGKDKLLQTCKKDYTENTNVNLYASPASGCPAGRCVLKKWDGACSGGNCSFAMDDNKTVNAYFKVSTGTCVSNCGGTDQCGSAKNTCGSGSLSDTSDTSTQYLWSCGVANCALDIVGDGTCSDGIKNQDETGIDTGGVCNTTTPSCSDGIQNQDETGVDTGGGCGDGSDGTCFDGIQNQNETGVDTGGVCGSGDGTIGPTLELKVGCGTVTVKEDGFTCNKLTCSQSYSVGTGLTLTATETEGSGFSSWGGDCTSTSGDTCSVTMDESKTVQAVFSPDTCGIITNSSSSSSSSGFTSSSSSSKPSVIIHEI